MRNPRSFLVPVLGSVLLLLVAAPGLAAPAAERTPPNLTAGQLSAEWSGDGAAQAELGKAFARRWAMWSLMTKEHLRHAAVQGDWEAWRDTGVPEVLERAELEALRQAMTPELLAAFEVVEAPMEKLWTRPTADGPDECYPLTVIGKMLGESLDVVETSWQMTTTEAPKSWHLTAEERSASETWSGTEAERQVLQDAFARRWVFWTMATKHDLRHAFAAGDWSAWQATGLTERLSVAELDAMRRAVTPAHLEALGEIDRAINDLWIIPRQEETHCYSLDVVRQMVDGTMDMVTRDWRVVAN